MKRFALVLGVCLSLCAGTAQAQLAPGTLLVSFHPTPASGADLIKNGVIAFVPFDFYVVSYSVPLGMEGYEFSLRLVPGMLISGGRVLPEGATDFGIGEDNWIVGTAAVCHGETGWFTLVSYLDALFLAAPPANSTICPRGSIPTSFADGQPGYLPCAAPGELMSFLLMDTLPLGPSCAILNWTGVPLEASSFGALKARY